MVRPSKKKDNKDKETASKTRTSPRKKQSGTARAGDEEEEPTTSQRDDLAEGDAGVTGDDNGSMQQLTIPFTAQQDEQIAAFFEEHKLFYDMAYGDYKNKKRDHLVLQFAQSLFPSGKCFLSLQYIFHKRVSSTNSCKISCENFLSFYNAQRVQAYTLRLAGSHVNGKVDDGFSQFSMDIDFKVETFIYHRVG